MIGIQLGLYKPQFKRGILFGEYHQYPIWVLSFGILTITWIKGRSAGLLLTAMKGLADDKDWLLENRTEIRLLKKRLKAKYRAKAKADFEETIQEYRQAYEDAEERRQKLASEVYILKSAIKLLDT